MDVAAIALASAACYALALVLAQIGLRRQSVLASATISLPTTAVVLGMVAAFRLDLARLDTTALAIFAGCGLVFPVAVTLLSFQSNRLLGPNLAGALGNATPIFAVAFGIVILGESVTLRQAAGLAAVVAGVALLSLRRGGGGRGWPVAALLVPLVAASIRGVVQPVVKLGLARWPDPLAATVVGYGISASVIVLIGLSRWRSVRSEWQIRALPIFAAVGLLNGASVLLMYTALNGGRVSLVAPLVATYPIFTLALSAWLLRGEPIHARLILGILATVAGIVLLLAG